jgi:hypothetical protein
MTHPTLANQIFGEMQREEGRKRRRHEAAKKAWRTRKRLAKPTPEMRKWLEWLCRLPTQAIVQRREDCYGSMFSFGCYPFEFGVYVSGTVPHFTRNTFFAMQKRGWIEVVHRTEKMHVGTMYSTVTQRHKDRYSLTIFWKVTDKGRKALERFIK